MSKIFLRHTLTKIFFHIFIFSAETEYISTRYLLQWCCSIGNPNNCFLDIREVIRSCKLNLYNEKKAKKTLHCRNSSKIQLENRRKERNNTIITEIHNLSLSSFGTGTSIKHGGAKLILWAQLFPVSEMIRS